MTYASAADITSALSRVAAVQTLLVVSDFDGTLAGFSTEALNVPVNRESINALMELGTVAGTHSAILSGRHLAGLQQVAGEVGGIQLVGSHGAEGIELTDSQAALLDSLTAELDALIDGIDGAFIEHKPVHRVLHYRKVSPELHDDLVARARSLEAEGVHVTHGKCIEEFSVVDVTKGTWISQARDRYNADAVVFLGDDFTDENGMRALGPNDLGVRVGEGETLAHLRVPDLEAVEALLKELLQMRRTVLPA
ncbi:Trehalose-6-phosphate phosphatase [Corynebacterium kalinowskii]|uniref:Trehalose 6-phosphate phosphatase n=1 Tax=Corynebacterium kalinowskii TaxID=2675216 RepID=A0A6B8VVG7_9CORY|nr:trehalose-phosphatase [Corynebacterium kalinowskii]QGU01290.1 Trehalose-6-phosphate phosphatase [Corynebacterium kalinowskii]